MPEVVIGNLLAEFFHELRALRPGADKAHIPAQYIPHLRNFIQAQMPQKAAHWGNARVVIRRPRRARIGLRIRAHGAEFVAGENVPAQAHPLLPVKHLARRAHFYRRGNEWNQRQGDHETRESKEERNHAADQQKRVIQTEALGKYQPARMKFMDFNLAGDFFKDRGGIVNFNARKPQVKQLPGGGPGLAI